MYRNKTRNVNLIFCPVPSSEVDKTYKLNSD